MCSQLQTLEREFGPAGGGADAVGGHAGVLARVPHFATFNLQHCCVVVIEHGKLTTLLQRLTVLQPRHLDGR